MFERFTDRARRTVVLAQEEARLLNHNWIGTEHLLLGLLHEGEGVGAKALRELGVDLDEVRDRVREVVGRGDSPPTGHVPFTPRAKKVLELSLREALTLGHNYIGTEHMLLGLVREGEGLAVEVLTNRGITLSRVREEVIRQLGGPAGTRRIRAGISGHGAGGPGGPGAGAPPTATGPFTPGASAALDKARELAGDVPVGTHHLLAAILADENSLGHKLLAGVQLDPQQMRQVAALDPTGTSDEMPEEAGARRTSIRLIGDKVAVLLEDPALRERLASAMNRMGREMLTRTDPVGAAFPRLWRSVNDALGEVLRRAEPTGPTGDPPWRPPALDTGWKVAAYAVTTGPTLQSRLILGEGVFGAGPVRAGLAEWLEANQPTGPAGQVPANFLAVTVDEAGPDDAAAWGSVTTFTWGSDGPGPLQPVSLLVAHAILDLTSPAASPATTPATTPATSATPPPAEPGEAPEAG